MKLTTLLLFLTLVQVSAKGYSQVTLHEKNASFEKVILLLKKQSGYAILYDQNVKTGPISIDVNNVSIQKALDRCFLNQPVTYEIVGNNILIKEKEVSFIDRLKSVLTNRVIHGLVADESGHPLPRITVREKGNPNNIASTDEKGFFSITVADKSVLIFSGVGLQTTEIATNDFKNQSVIVMKLSTTNLSEVVVGKGYYNETKELSTGNSTRISSKDLETQPVENPLQALEGRVPGMVVSQTTGVPGGTLNVEIRGRSNFDKNISSDQPLIILDGVPMAAGNNKMNLVGAPFGSVPNAGLSALAGINPLDIASIDVLKDADATAIYGSRGANGVIVITTKKGKAGKTKLDANVTSGVSVVSSLPQMLNTQQYVAMRNQAFTNDKITKTTSNAYDLMLWDTTRYTNIPKLLEGNTAHTYDAGLTFSGGNKNVQYRLGGNFHKEGTVWPGSESSQRASLSFNIHSISDDQKFTMDFSGMYSMLTSDLLQIDLGQAISLPPNFKFYNADGSLAWNEGNVYEAKNNPLAALNQTYNSSMASLNGNMLLSYSILKNLTVRSSFGYNASNNNEKDITPISSLNPLMTNLNGSAYTKYGTNQLNNWIIEPQVEYTHHISKGKLDILVGGTLSQRNNTALQASASGYTSDALINNLQSGTTSSITASNSYIDYKYEAVFGRVNYNWEDKYVVNFTGRRDGSSRFGPNARFANFGAVGGAWVFTNESWLKDNNILSFGKLRGSYGVTGNDQIGDYTYLDAWVSNPNYASGATLVASKLYNPNLHWERDSKSEIAVELGFLKDRIMFSASAYSNITSDPLVSYPLSSITGFTSIVENEDGVRIQNKGLEITLTTRNIANGSFKWTTDFNITTPKNVLLAYPNLATSSYANSYAIGQSLTRKNAAQYVGVDPTTGLYTVKDVNGDGVVNSKDYAASFNLDPKFYGGLNNTFSYHKFTFSFFLQYDKQMGTDWRISNLYNPPGGLYNEPVPVLSAWTTPGQNTNVQKYTTQLGSITGTSGFYPAAFSNAFYTDVSYIRLKNAFFSYDLPSNWLNAVHVTSCRIYLQGQNLFVISPYKSGDPEVQSYTREAPLRTIIAGLQLTL
ncbi:SusC/RagA family TonB-linked outer membrane protein [Pedobacter sp. L105]|uniref:SusC/RagA family TonB-linked outer membrane protein n=1 Tax=Pedobacter sp. L105 TaxID=1641871 RepID=UPI00131CEE81|nr:SusC/RagA family TonB-linked outer membrane protein [Pedobacter sp. L105]